jgi:hypothetical protein
VNPGESRIVSLSALFRRGLSSQLSDSTGKLGGGDVLCVERILDFQVMAREVFTNAKPLHDVSD